jgi:hypothetical protein
VQSFRGVSPMRDLEEATGQFQLYRMLLSETEPERTLYLAVPRHVYDRVFIEPLGQLVVAHLPLRLVVFDDVQQRIVQWIK